MIPLAVLGIRIWVIVTSMVEPLGWKIACQTSAMDDGAEPRQMLTATLKIRIRARMTRSLPGDRHPVLILRGSAVCRVSMRASFQCLDPGLVKNGLMKKFEQTHLLEFGKHSLT